MAVHRTILSSLCRLCGAQDINVTDTTPKETLSRDISLIFSVDVTSDDSQIHPPNVCDACRLKISRWKQNRRRKGSHNLLPPNIELKDFMPHDVNCDVCRTKQWDKDITLKACRNDGFFAWEKEDGIVAIKVNLQGSCILKRITVTNEKVECYVIGKKIDMNFSNPQEAIQYISNSKVCVGNLDFDNLAKSHGSEFRGRDGQLIALVERNALSNKENAETIRHVHCKLLLTESESATNRANETCSVCSMYRQTLSALALKQQTVSEKAEQSKSKHKPTIQMTVTELHEKVVHLTREKKNLSERSKRLSERVKQSFQEESIELGDTDKKSVQELLDTSKNKIKEALKGDSYCQPLWEQQVKAHERNPKQMRWHPAILRWAIAIHSKSASAYDLIRKSGFLVLPHANTLYQYTHFTDPTTGINPDVLSRYYIDFKMDKLKDHERLVSLLIDEMKVKAGLVFSKSTGRLVGFTSVGTINEEMSSFERKYTSKEEPEDRPLASHILLYMVRGITTPMKFPAAYYASSNVTGSQLYETTMEVVAAVKLLGIQVLCLVSDGASANRRLYDILGGKSGSVLNPQYCTTNAYGSGEVFFVCDPPHLLKTLRNNFENSNWNRKTRNLLFRNKKIQWTQLVQLQEWDHGKGRSAPGLRLLPKLGYEHLHLTPGLRMKVSIAAQVMSNSVANALRVWKRSGLESTIEFVEKVNKFFDCLNVSSLKEGKRKRNDNLLPYVSVDDPRLQWLEEDFLGFLREWVEEGTKQENLTPKERKKQCISDATIIGCHITVRSFIAMTKLLLTTSGVEYVLSDKFNQDPLEEFFGKQRSAGGHLDNPTVEQFGHSLMRNIVAGQYIPGPSRGNVRSHRTAEVDIADDPLPKRRRHRLGRSKEAPC